MSELITVSPDTAPVTVPFSYVTPAQSLTPMEMLSRAVNQGATVEVLEKLMGLQERWEQSQSRKAFDTAIASAKAEIPVIIKNKVVDFTSQKGRTNYAHEDLAEIARTIDPILAKYGLSYRFRIDSQPGVVLVTCIVSHRDGYSEENTLPAPHDVSGNKNSIQAVGSTITYLQRYTLKASLGLAAAKDDDARSSGASTAISDEQIDTLRSLIVEVGADIPLYCKYMKVGRIEEITTRDYDRAVAALEAKRGAA